MKKVCFVLVVIFIYFTSCTSSKESACLMYAKDYDKDPYVHKFSKNPYFITPAQACGYIDAYKKSKYKILGKGKLQNAWSKFDKKTIDSLASDSQTDSIFFLLAAYSRKDTSVEKKYRGHPFVIMEGIQHATGSSDGKGGNEESLTAKPSVYFIPIHICPPPNTGCKIPGVE